MRHLVREMAERVAGQRLRVGEELELVAAEVFSAISIDPAFVARPDEPPEWLGGDATGTSGEEEQDHAALAARAPGREWPRAIASLAAGLGEADAFELDRRLRLAEATTPLLSCAPGSFWRLDAPWAVFIYSFVADGARNSTHRCRKEAEEDDESIDSPQVATQRVSGAPGRATPRRPI